MRETVADKEPAKAASERVEQTAAITGQWRAVWDKVE